MKSTTILANNKDDKLTEEQLAKGFTTSKELLARFGMYLDKKDLKVTGVSKGAIKYTEGGVLEYEGGVFPFQDKEIVTTDITFKITKRVAITHKDTIVTKIKEQLNASVDSYTSGFKMPQYFQLSNKAITKKALGFKSYTRLGEEDVDEIIGTTVFLGPTLGGNYNNSASMWVKVPVGAYDVGYAWCLKKEVLTTGKWLALKQRVAYVQSLLDMHYDEKSSSNPLVQITAIVVVVVLAYFLGPAAFAFAGGIGATGMALVAAYAFAVVVVSLTISLVAVVVAKLGQPGLAMELMRFNKAIAPIVHVANIILIVYGMVNVYDAAAKFAADAAATSLATAIENFVAAKIESMSYTEVYQVALRVADMVVKNQMEIASRTAKENQGLLKQSEALAKEIAAKEAGRNSDMFFAFMHTKHNPADCDWSELSNEQMYEPTRTNVQATYVMGLAGEGAKTYSSYSV
jgi:hypothetical protein